MVGRIPQQVIDEVQSKTDIAEIVGRYVQLKKSGKNYTGLCPFHEEKTPSFSVVEDKQIFYCFGCKKGGNVFSFIQDIEGVSFPEAVVKVAEMENIPIDASFAENRGASETNSQNKQLIQLHEKAAEVYHHMLVNTVAGQAALDYLLKRGLTQELIDEFQIGFAPNQREFLRQVLTAEKATPEAMEQTGLFVKRENGELVDRFYQRIMFPIRDPQGKTIAFSGRFLATEAFDGKDQPKYLNSPETELFNKRLVLFNFDKARSVIRKENRVFLFEGFMDVLAAWQAGIKNGIASMGTSLTSQQIAAIERVTGDLSLSYDGDSAGTEATYRAIQLMQEHSRLQLDVVSMPGKLDPDEYVRKYGEEAFYELATHGRDTVFSFMMRYRKLNRNMSNPKEQMEYVQEILQDLVHVDSLIEQDQYLTQISGEFHIGRDALQQQLRQYKQNERQHQRQEPQQVAFPENDYAPPAAIPEQTSRSLSQVEKAEQLLLHRLFNDYHLNHKLKGTFEFKHDIYQQIYFLYDAYIESKGEFVLADFFNVLSDKEIQNKVSEIVSLTVPEESSENEIQFVLRLFQKADITEMIEEKKIQQLEASQKGNDSLALNLAVEILDLTKQLKQFESH